MVDYQGQIDSAQTQLEMQRVDRKQRLEQLRRDLEGLKKMDLIQENRYRELRDSFGLQCVPGWHGCRSSTRTDQRSGHG